MPDHPGILLVGSNAFHDGATDDDAVGQAERSMIRVGLPWRSMTVVLRSAAVTTAVGR